MAKFAEGQRVRVSSSTSSAPRALRGQLGIITSVVVSQVPYDFIAAHALEDQTEQQYDVKFDIDEKVRRCGERLLETG